MYLDWTIKLFKYIFYLKNFKNYYLFIFKIGGNTYQYVLISKKVHVLIQ
jgi:hypothetical protein